MVVSQIPHDEKSCLQQQKKKARINTVHVYVIYIYIYIYIYMTFPLFKLRLFCVMPAECYADKV